VTDPLDIAYTEAVKQAQTQRGTRSAMARGRLGAGWFDTATADLAAFLAERDHFFLGTASAAGQPYIQHRGGPPGFLKVLDEKTLGFADFRGNRQYISVGNLAENDRAFIFVIDYALQRRIKLWGRAEIVEGDAVLLQRLHDLRYQARPERAMLFHLDLWAINCPQHITQRVSADEIAPVLARYEARIAELEAELALRKEAAPPP
jgi:predicted pyridoxine 5'-phosphate oxidase superfamily flavin-nucleotide-binding protein